MAQQQTPAIGAEVHPDLLVPIGGEVSPDQLIGDVTAAPVASHDASADPSFLGFDTRVPIANQLMMGVAKGFGNTAVGLGELVHKIPGVSTLTDAVYGTPGLSDAAFPAAREAMKAHGTGEVIGNLAEQGAEFFTPTGLTGKIGKMGEIAKVYGLTRAQGGGPGAATVSSGLTALMPGAAGAKKVAGALENSAERTIVRALGPTTKEMKVTARELAPEMLKRGIGGSRNAMLEEAKDQIKQKVGPALEAEFSAAEARGENIGGAKVLSAIEKAKASLMTPDAKGVPIIVRGNETAWKELDQLHRFVSRLSPDLPINQARAIRQTLDDIADRAGLFGANALASATDKSKAWAAKEASDSLRDMINSRNASIQDLNKEMSFWLDLRKVLDATDTRTLGQGSSLTSTLAGVGGAVMGGAAAGWGGGAAGYLVMQQMTKMMQSPTARTRLTAPMTKALADALATQNMGKALTILRTVSSAAPSQVSR